MGVWAKMTYDGIELKHQYKASLWDGPDDGGRAVANWTLVHDEDFARYLVYLNEGPWTTQPTVELQPRALMVRKPTF